MLAAGGLFVLGTERHESRRIDNQLRGRSGRQGDPGASKFFLSLEDDLMRIFGSERIDGMLQRLGLKEGEAIIHPWVNKALEKAQQKVEARNFDIRKNLLKYDDVMNDQRKVVYEQRKEFMHADDVAQTVTDMRHDVIDAAGNTAHPAQRVRRAVERARAACRGDCASSASTCRSSSGPRKRASPTRRSAPACAITTDRKMAEKAANYGADVMRMVEKSLLLQILDQVWKEHLLALDHLRQGIGLRAYAQRDPLNEYKREAFALFEAMLERLRERVTQVLAHVELRVDPALEPELHQALQPPPQQMHESRDDPAFAEADAPREPAAATALAQRPAPARSRAADPARRSARSRQLGPDRPQRPLSLRLRQEVQALPRPRRLAAGLIRSTSGFGSPCSR